MGQTSIPVMKLEQREGVWVATLREPLLLDESTAREIELRLLEITRQEQNPRLIVDFSRVEQVASSMLGTLISVHRSAKDKRGQVCMVGVKGGVLEAVRLTFDSMIPMAESVAKALKSLGRDDGGSPE